MYESSDDLDKLFEALAQAQGEMEVAGKDSTNPMFKSSYADLTSIVRASRPALSKYGLSVMHVFELDGDKQVLATILGHSSGQFIKSSMAFDPPEPTLNREGRATQSAIHILGSYVTYLKRYAYQALTGVTAANDDDDGEKVRAAEEEKRAVVQRERMDKMPLTTEQLSILNDKLNSSDRQQAEGWIAYVMDHYKVNSLSSLPSVAFPALLKHLEKTVGE